MARRKSQPAEQPIDPANLAAGYMFPELFEERERLILRSQEATDQPFTPSAAVQHTMPDMPPVDWEHIVRKQQAEQRRKKNPRHAQGGSRRSPPFLLISTGNLARRTTMPRRHTPRPVSALTNAAGAAMDDTTIMQRAPAIFAERPAPTTSASYTFIPTCHVLDLMRGQGYAPVHVAESRTRIEEKRRLHPPHDHFSPPRGRATAGPDHRRDCIDATRTMAAAPTSCTPVSFGRSATTACACQKPPCRPSRSAIPERLTLILSMGPTASWPRCRKC